MMFTRFSYKGYKYFKCFQIANAHSEKPHYLKSITHFGFIQEKPFFLLASSFSQGPRRSFLHFLGYLTPDIWPIREN